jgi:alpha-glucosidase
MISREGARGQEYNAWSGDGGNPPDHTTIIPFTRMLGGPFDFTPGIFDLFFTEAGRPKNRVNTTLAKQLALYVVIYSPMQMAADLPENYEGHPAFEFIETVPSDWEETVALHASIGDFVTVARKQRGGDDWFIGSITDEDGRTLEAPLSFLDDGIEYEATIYADAPGADWKNRPYMIDIRKERVDSSSILRLELAPGGGQAVRLSPVTPSPE